jgi:hypothetical protein
VGHQCELGFLQNSHYAEYFYTSSHQQQIKEHLEDLWRKMNLIIFFFILGASQFNLYFFKCLGFFVSTETAFSLLVVFTEKQIFEQIIDFLVKV